MTWLISLLILWCLAGLAAMVYLDWRDGRDLTLGDLLTYLLLLWAGPLVAMSRLKVFSWVLLRGKR